jgi:hypothetical protein
MGGHQHEHILQEDEGVVNWHGEQYSCQESSEEEVSWLDESPSALLVDLQDHCVEGSFGLFDFHHFESSAHNAHKEHWHNNGQNKDHIGDHGGKFPHLGGVISVDDLHG